ncbi:MAG: hypothetical protein BWY83_03429 [bacterium ADurb.Bin478]|nr:MAG: hypothetical protein BWY83_03429 [bacterium ADurb.Bin478]
MRPGRHAQIDGGARGGAIGDQIRQLIQAELFGLAGGEHDVHDIVLDFRIDVHFVHHFFGAQNFVRRHHRFGLRQLGRGHAAHDLQLLAAIRITDRQLEHKAVHLRLRQRVGALLFDRVLGGQHQKGRRQGEGLIAQCNLAFLHGLQQSGLHFGRGTVDLVRQHQVGKDRALFSVELAGALIIDQRADDVRRQQIRGELNALELSADD